VKNKFEWIRLILAAMISPSVPILGLATTLARTSGSQHWYPIVFLFGYLFFCLIGFPVIGVLIRKRTLISCLIAGGAITIVPILLLSLFSLPSSNNVYGGRMLLDLLILFAMGMLGGLLFWGLAFAGTNKDRSPGSSA
jgi:hypothetical protein